MDSEKENLVGAELAVARVSLRSAYHSRRHLALVVALEGLLRVPCAPKVLLSVVLNEPESMHSFAKS